MTAVGTIAMTLFTGFLAHYASNQEEIIGAQLKTMQVDSRSWIGAPKVSASPVASDHIAFQIELRNAGKSPNTGLRSRIAVVDEAHWRVAEEALCRAERSRPADPVLWKPDAGLSIVPGDAFRYEDVAPMTIPIAKEPRLIGCITYVWNKEIHQTGFYSRLRFDQDGKVDASEVYAINPD